MVLEMTNDLKNDQTIKVRFLYVEKNNRTPKEIC